MARNGFAWPWALAAALTVAAAKPAAALQTVSYFGTVLLRSHSSTGRREPGSLDGTYAFAATFRYDDTLAPTSATLIVDGRLRSHYSYCPSEDLSCPPLFITPTGIGSGAGTTPEDYMSAGVTSPSQFAGQNLLGPFRKTYILGPGDEGTANISWALFDNASGFAWNEGQGIVTRIETGIPEPAGWTLLVVGFALLGSALRRTALPAYAEEPAAGHIACRQPPASLP